MVIMEVVKVPVEILSVLQEVVIVVDGGLRVRDEILMGIEVISWFLRSF